MKFSLSFTIPCLMAGAILFMGGCSPIIDNRGYETDAVDFSKIKPGMTQDDVMSMLGSPSTVSTHTPMTWYYATKVTETKGFFQPKTTEQSVTAIQFDPQGRVQELEKIEGHAAKTITPNKMITQTAGHESGILKEVFSNFGRISSQSGKK